MFSYSNTLPVYVGCFNFCLPSSGKLLDQRWEKTNLTYAVINIIIGLQCLLLEKNYFKYDLHIFYSITGFRNYDIITCILLFMGYLDLRSCKDNYLPNRPNRRLYILYIMNRVVWLVVFVRFFIIFSLFYINILCWTSDLSILKLYSDLGILRWPSDLDCLRLSSDLAVLHWSSPIGGLGWSSDMVILC